MLGLSNRQHSLYPGRVRGEAWEGESHPRPKKPKGEPRSSRYLGPFAKVIANALRRERRRRRKFAAYLAAPPTPTREEEQCQDLTQECRPETSPTS